MRSEAEYEERRKEHEEEQQRRQEERKQQFEREQEEYETERTRRKALHKARQATFERIVENTPAMFTAAQLRVFLRALINLDPYDFAEDVAAYFVGDDEDNQTPEEVLTSTLTSLPDEKLTSFALRLALTGHRDPARKRFRFPCGSRKRFPLSAIDTQTQNGEAIVSETDETHAKEGGGNKKEDCSVNRRGRYRAPAFLRLSDRQTWTPQCM